MTFVKAGRTRRVAAVPMDGRWVTPTTLAKGEAAYVCPGGVRDEWRNFNGGLSAAVGDATVRIDCTEPAIVGVTPVTTGTAPAAVGDAGRAGAGGVGPGETGRASVLGLPEARTQLAGAKRARTCRRARSLRLRLRAPRAGMRIRSAVVLVNGERVRSVRGRAARAAFRVPLRGGRSVVTVRLRGSDGRTYVARRTYRRCPSRRR